ncbi:MAG: hypothetical protein KGL18_05285 [Burkholderiales bacterium]|nr:hypothetical protein [Burkholderiales bacterium]MDE1927920.1 hypothetical protein [Burkholderiales bacterium]MDE2157312.1 hypothetical protein [Burkholderiales bacterium]MDE2502373.1 hypothetical protein [Burkholderiales bacterium]
MKVAVINFSGNVGKSTIARHLLLPRFEGAELIAVESLNADDGQGKAIRGRQFGELQEYLNTMESVVVDIGASNVEDLLALMTRYRGSHEDFDCFVVPTVSALKQQRDTIATLTELGRLGIPPTSLKLVFNMVEDGVEVAQCFESLLAFVAQHGLAVANPACRVGVNEVYGRLKGSTDTLDALARDETDYKALIAKAPTVADKLALAQKLATHRLASGVLQELDACYAALEFAGGASHNVNR